MSQSGCAVRKLELAGFAVVATAAGHRLVRVELDTVAMVATVKAPYLRTSGTTLWSSWKVVQEAAANRPPSVELPGRQDEARCAVRERRRGR